MTWNLHPKGLSAFDVHSTSGVFAACVFFLQLLTLNCIHIPYSTSAINPAYWKSQHAFVRSLVQSEPLSAFSFQTGLSTFPIRGFPSPFIPRHSSLVFHPTEMLYALGGPDGTGKSMSRVYFHDTQHGNEKQYESWVAIFLEFIDTHKNYFPISTYHELL